METEIYQITPAKIYFTYNHHAMMIQYSHKPFEMAFRKSREIGTQPSSRNDASNSKDLEQFWSSLRKTNDDQNKKLDQLRRRKTSEYFSDTLKDLAGVAHSTENLALELDDIIENRERELLQSANFRVLDSRRFKSKRFTQSSLSLPLDTYLREIPQSWSSQISALEADLKQRKAKNFSRIKKPKSSRIISNATPLSPQVAQHSGISGLEMPRQWVLDARDELERGRREALEIKISSERKAKLCSELSDFDIINRPTHYLHLNTKSEFPPISPPDPLEGTPSIANIYSDLQGIISKRSLNTVLRKPELYWNENGDDEYSKFCIKNQRLKIDEKIGEIQKEKTIGLQNIVNTSPLLLNSNNEKMYEINKATKALKRGIIAIHPKDKEIDENLKASCFEQECLRDLVNITLESGHSKLAAKNEQDDEGWETEEDETT